MSWLFTHAPIRVPEEKYNKEPTESTCKVSIKDPSKVKSIIEEFPRTQKCKELGNFMYLEEIDTLWLNSGVELIKIP